MSIMYRVSDKMLMKIMKYVIFVSKKSNIAFFSKKKTRPSVNFVEILNAPKTLQNKKKLSRGLYNFQKLSHSLVGVFYKEAKCSFFFIK